jgi:hypothetical protein
VSLDTAICGNASPPAEPAPKAAEEWRLDMPTTADVLIGTLVPWDGMQAGISGMWSYAIAALRTASALMGRNTSIYSFGASVAKPIAKA